MKDTEQRDYISYEYKKIPVSLDQYSFLLDCYRNFGWMQDENIAPADQNKLAVLYLRRDQNIINRTELTRLQRNFEGCLEEIKALEQAKKSVASIWAICIGIIGTAFIAGSVFAFVHEPPLVWLSVLLAVPGFLGWIFPYFIYRAVLAAREKKLSPLIETKYEEIRTLCKKGFDLLI